mmetsp:Transcript_31980/g.74924  ORF Transcript_31980/g.74924 Transcript_31980/m.74924 type:complete len:205 (+) Transcript_31980:553-1167(+)
MARRGEELLTCLPSASRGIVLGGPALHLHLRCQRDPQAGKHHHHRRAGCACLLLPLPCQCQCHWCHSLARATSRLTLAISSCRALGLRRLQHLSTCPLHGPSQLRRLPMWNLLLGWTPSPPWRAPAAPEEAKFLLQAAPFLQVPPSRDRPTSRRRRRRRAGLTTPKCGAAFLAARHRLPPLPPCQPRQPAAATRCPARPAHEAQ